MAGVESVALYAEEAAERQKRKPVQDQHSVIVGNTLTKSGKATEAAAKDVGVSGSLVTKAKRVIDDGDPELIEDVKNGKTTVTEASTKVAKKKHREKPEPKSDNITQLLDHEGNGYDYKLPKGKATFNKTTDAVDWATWTWNPVTGCLHGCQYCYAREIANQKKMRASYPAGFTPLFHPERLPAPKNTKPGTKRPQDGRVFVGSMTDLFGEWVPEQWIKQVFEACNAAPDWEYLFLTKFPKRYKRIDLPPHMWAGASVDTQKRIRGTESAMKKLDVKVRWLSIEPLLEPLQFSDLSWCDLMVIGSQSRTVQPDGTIVEAFAPHFEWVNELVMQAREANVPVYMKPNLSGVTSSENPGMELPQEQPRTK